MKEINKYMLKKWKEEKERKINWRYNMNNLKKWIKDYIEGIELDQVKWVNLNAEEFGDFLEKNYYDDEIWSYVLDESADGVYPIILGMRYLNLNHPQDNEVNDYKFLLGIVNNKVGKKTIVGATTYIDDYYMFQDQKKPVTYIASAEVNSYFREKGIFKKMCEELLSHINPEQHIVTSQQSEMGKQCKAFDVFKEILESKGFQKGIYEDTTIPGRSRLHDIFCENSKALIRKPNNYK